MHQYVEISIFLMKNYIEMYLFHISAKYFDISSYIMAGTNKAAPLNSVKFRNPDKAIV